MPERASRCRRARGGRPLGGWALAFALVLCAALAPAALAAPGRDAIMSIRVEGADWIPAEILLAESLLEEGRSYSRRALEDAVYRIVRLPFVLGAGYAVEEDEQAGARTLVIRVRPARRWVFGLEPTTTRWAEPVSLEGLETDDLSASASPRVGRRFVVGRRSLLTLSAGGDEGALEVGWTRFALGGRGMRLDLRLGFAPCDLEREASDGLPDETCATEIFELDLDPAFSSWSSEGDGRHAAAALHLPLRGNHALRFAAAWRDVERGYRRAAYQPGPFDAYEFEDLEETTLRLAWEWNATDDPVLPRRGMAFEAGIERRTLDARLQSFDLPFLFGPVPVLLTEVESDSVLLFVSAARHHLIAHRHTLRLAARAAFGLTDVAGLPLPGRRVIDDELDASRLSLSLAHGWDLVRVHRLPRWRDLRWETGGELFRDATSPRFDLPDNPLEGYRVHTGLLLRTTWGVFRVRFVYLDTGR